METNAPTIAHHLLLCATSQKSLCCDPYESIESWKKLKGLIQELNLEDPKHPKGIVLRSKVDCLRVCKSGPILLIWPEGIWYKNVSPHRIEVILKQHILLGKPVKEWILKRTSMKITSV